MEVVKSPKSPKVPKPSAMELVESNELAILVSTQPWSQDPQPSFTRGRRILWPLMSLATADDESPFSL